jgi:hypothetical protein
MVPEGARLLDRQQALIDYLRNPAAFLDHEFDPGQDIFLRGLDRERLRLVGTVALAKRIGKIEAVLPKTVSYLRTENTTSFHEFASEHPPSSSRRYDNAQQFYRYLRDRWTTHPPVPPFLRDLAACEWMLAQVRHEGSSELFVSRCERHFPDENIWEIRRAKAVKRLECNYDVRSLLEPAPESVRVPERQVFLVFTPDSSPIGARVFEVAREVYELLESLDDWCSIHDLGLESETRSVIHSLIARGILEVGP